MTAKECSNVQVWVLYEWNNILLQRSKSGTELARDWTAKDDRSRQANITQQYNLASDR